MCKTSWLNPERVSLTTIIAQFLGVTGHAIGIVADVSQTSEIERLVAQVRSQHGVEHLDVLVANAGATWGGPFEPTPDSSNVKVLDTNVRGVFNLVRLYVSLSTFSF